MLQVLESLGTETVRPSSASQCVAHIACAELPQAEWPELISLLTQNVTNPASTEMMKEASLEAIGYICQDIVSMKGFPIVLINMMGGYSGELCKVCSITIGQYSVDSVQYVTKNLI